MPDIGAGFYSTFRLLSAGTTNATLVKGGSVATPGQLGGYYLKNNAAYDVFLKLYDSNVIPTAGAGTPKLTIGVPTGGGANLSIVGGLNFNSGIGFTITKLVADNDTTVVVANDLIVNLFYA